MVCLGFEPGPKDGRCKRNHRAMESKAKPFYTNRIFLLYS